MHRRCLIVAGTLVCQLAIVGSAFAATQTVSGQGDLKKMTVNNGRTAVTVKLNGFKGPCDAKQFTIDVLWSTKPVYQVQAGCTGGRDWTGGLYYTAVRGQGLEPKKIACRGFKLTYASAGKVWTAVVPRSCILKASNRIRVRAEGINYAGSAIPGVSGPTRLLARG